MWRVKGREGGGGVEGEGQSRWGVWRVKGGEGGEGVEGEGQRGERGCGG